MTDSFDVFDYQQVNKYSISHHKGDEIYGYTLVRNDNGSLDLYGENNHLIQSSVSIDSIKDVIESTTNWHLDTLNTLKEQLIPEYIQKTTTGRGFYK